MLGLGVGVCFSATQLAWYPDPVKNPEMNKAVINPALAKMTAIKTGTQASALLRVMARSCFWLSSTTMSFAAAECTAEAVRGTSDSWNSVIGGFAGGAVLGAVSKRFDIMFSAAVGTSIIMGCLDFSGPHTVHPNTKDELANRIHGHLPVKHKESNELAALKEKYPEFKNN